MRRCRFGCCGRNRSGVGSLVDCKIWRRVVVDGRNGVGGDSGERRS